MIYIVTFVAILAVHWFADFVCQTDWQAKNKSKNLNALLRHVGVYTGILAVGSLLILGFERKGVIFFIVANGLLHLVTDFVTSRLASRLYAQGRIHGFFVMIGFDQLIHQATLAITLILLVS